jgi:hypothetical protein
MCVRKQVRNNGGDLRTARFPRMRPNVEEEIENNHWKTKKIADEHGVMKVHTKGWLVGKEWNNFVS